jgi:arsenate reductase
MSDTWRQEAERLRLALPGHVLFLCVANSARSQMAEGIARALAPASVKVSSAGSQPSGLNPLAVKALAEIGIDISGHLSKSVNDIPSADVDAVITLCAEEVCPAWLGKAIRLHWGLPDPARAGTKDAERLQAFRDVRDELRKRLAVVFRQPDAEAVRSR